MRRILVIAALGAGLLPHGAAPAAVSCAQPPSIGRAVADAPTAFVGTVLSTSNGRRWATVEVLEVWKGDVEAEVEVRGGPEDPAGPMMAASSVDRSYSAGKTYLFLPYAGHGDVFQDNACSSTVVYRESLGRLRPPGARFVEAPPPPPSSPPESPGGGASPAWWAAAAAAAAAVVAGAAVRRRRAAA